MKILFLSAEVEPFAKVGGLADVAGSLPKALQDLGHEIRVVMPAYGMVINDERWGAQKILSQVPVTVNEHLTILADLYEIKHNEVTYWLISGDGYFQDVSRSEEVYTAGREAYLFFSQAALEVCAAQFWVPDIVHANDWHMAFANVFLREKTDWQSTASIYTIHNLAYQGQFGADTIEIAGLDWDTFNFNQLETWGGVNFLKSGCVYADRVNTVSPTYAKEIQTPEYGCQLWGLMQHLNSEGRLSGILNGIDVENHNPGSDTRIPGHFSQGDLAGKQECKRQLCLKLGLNLDQPLMGVISRLSEQKGFDLILSNFRKIMERGASLVILAIGDPALATEFRKLQVEFSRQFAFIEAYDAVQAQEIYAAMDIFLMPSKFEPCGLGQMFAMRYGSVPVVRATGGLADTVHDGVNGFTFEDPTGDAFGAALDDALNTFGTEKWAELIQNCMSGDYSWQKSALAYEDLYRAALESRLSEADCKDCAIV